MNLIRLSVEFFHDIKCQFGQAGVIQAIEEAILNIFEEDCPPTPENVAKKLVWSDALTIDAIWFIVEEGELEKLPNRGVRIPETANQ